nr:hypothetical protein [uncultured Pseudomonas sp.]
MSTTEATPSAEELAALEALFAEMAGYFSESGERRRFMHAANGLSESDLYLLQAVLGGKLKLEAARAGAASAQSPLRIANALLELETTVKKSKDRVLLDFIFALLQSKKVAKGLSRVWFFPWELALILNKNLTAEHVRFIWLSKKEDYAKELVPSSARVLVKHPNCPPDVLEELLPCDDAMLRKSIAMHQNTSAEITRFFLNSQRKPERLSLALSRYASSDVLLSLLEDKYDEISRAAKKNLAKRFPTQEVTAAVKTAIASNIAKPFVKPVAPKAPFNPWEAARASNESILAMESGQRKRVADATSDPELLRLLAMDSSKAVRRAVAKKALAGLDVLTVLAKDPDTETSNSALRAISRISPGVIAEDILSVEAINAAYREIALHVAQNSRKPYYDEHFSAQEKLRFSQALLVAEHTNNPMIQLMLVKDLETIPPTSTVRWDLLSAVSANRHLSEAVCRKIVVVLEFGAWGPIERCNSSALLREFLEPGSVKPHYHSTIEARLAVLMAKDSIG